MPVVLSGTNGVTFPDSSLQVAAASPYVLKNRLINGDMRVDQRNAGASVTITTSNQYTVDRWQGGATVSSKFSVQQNAGSVTPPAGFTNYLGCTSLAATSLGASDYYVVQQKIEGLNIADLAWGTASAQTVTLSFWVRSSLTGTFGGTIQNSSGGRSYVFTYTISAANTWEQKSITITGDTSGTWLTTNGIGMYLLFSLGVGSTFSGTAGSWSGSNLLSATGATSVVGTNGATWYVTGTQLEIGSTATPFERRLYNQELANCQRYYYRQQASALSDDFGVGYITSATGATILSNFPVSMRTVPSALEQSGTASNYQTLSGTGGGVVCSAVPVLGVASTWGARTSVTVASGLTTGQAVILRANNTNSAYLGWSAEL